LDVQRANRLKASAFIDLEAAVDNDPADDEDEDDMDEDNSLSSKYIYCNRIFSII
jgi:hypothetical protein